jgi:hypothetical protein
MTLQPWTLAIAFLPLVVAGFSLYVISCFGLPDPPKSLTPAPDVFVESAARLRMLATWVVMAILSAGATGYFLMELRKFEARSFYWLLGTFLFLLVILFGRMAFEPNYGRAENSIGEVTLCLAFGGKSSLVAPASAGPAKVAPAAPPSIQAGSVKTARTCSDAPKYDQLRRLNGIQRILLLLVLPAMILGAISTLATGATAREQAVRLKTYLYLAAILFVCGLLYLSALLRWPGSLLPAAEATKYSGLVDAYLLALGATYSLVIISYYLPVALRLSANAGPVVAFAARDKKESKEAEGEDVLGPLEILKVLVALFAPVIAALLGGVIKL